MRTFLAMLFMVNSNLVSLHAYYMLMNLRAGKSLSLEAQVYLFSFVCIMLALWMIRELVSEIKWRKKEELDLYFKVRSRGNRFRNQQ